MMLSFSPSPSPSPSKEEKMPATSKNWLELPWDVTANILQRLGPIEILESAQKVCTFWRRVCKDPAMWRVIDFHDNPDNGNPMFYDDFVKMCMHAVDRSQGQLLDISIEYFATDDLLLYIADRSSQLRRLQLVRCEVSEGLKDMVKKLPSLEELHLFYTWIPKEGIETVGRCCPLLKSFKFDEKGCTRTVTACDEAVISIAENMPGLRHLSLYGRMLTDTSLLAIVDKCAHLESLDLRECVWGLADGDVLKRCSEQIKDVKLPFDPTDDYMFGAGIYYQEPDGNDGYSDDSGCCCCGEFEF